MRLGDLTLHVLPDGEFRLDGGAMFGVVPKVLWEAVKPADEKNRISMTTNCLLVESGDELVLIDTGLGDKLDAREREIYAMAPDAVRLPDRLAEAGFAPEDVTHVLLSHLHFDHCGWNTRETATGLAPTFPEARYWIDRAEIDHARTTSARDRASYMPENWEPLIAAGVVELFDGEAEPAPGVRAVRAPGHTPGMCVVRLDGSSDGSSGGGSDGGSDGGGSEQGIFFADLVPTTAHVRLPWIMAFDLEPMKTRAEKERWIPRAAEEGWLCLFEHDPETPLGRVEGSASGRFQAAPI